MDREDAKRKLTKPLEILGRYKYVLLVVALGAALLAWPGSRKPGGSSPGSALPEAGSAVPAGRENLADTERAMEEILGKISGVGRVDVMLTLHSGGELVLAQDTSLRYSGPTQNPDSYERTSDTVSGTDGVVVTQEKYPLYRGALVVCEGGGSDSVRLQVVEAVAALTGLGADRIAVVQWSAASGGGGANSNN